MDKENIDKLLAEIVNCFEKLFSSFTIVQGRMSTYTLFVCIALTAISSILDLLGFYTFLSLPEGVIACLFSAVMVYMSKDNTKAIANLKLKLKKGVKRNER